MTTMSEQINELMAALSKAQGMMDAATKDKTNPFFKSKYADLASVVGASRQALSENGLSVVQTTRKNADNTISLITTLGHASGQWIQGEMPITVTKNDPQGFGSALTYFRRYSYSAMVGIITEEDDDGNTAQSKAKLQEIMERKTPEPKKVDSKPITKEQAEELKALFAQCDAGHNKIAQDFLANEKYAGKLENISFAIYENFKAGCLKNIEQNKQHAENSGVPV